MYVYMLFGDIVHYLLHSRGRDFPRCPWPREQRAALPVVVAASVIQCGVNSTQMTNSWAILAVFPLRKRQPLPFPERPPPGPALQCL